MFSESLARPLINNPAEWDVLINKFKIDTFSIPITIVKLKEYQPVRTDGKYLTDCNVQVIHNGYVYSAPCYFKPEHQSPDTNPSVVSIKEDGLVKYDNTEEAFFVYSYQQILDMVNEAIEEVCAEAGLDGDYPHFGISNSDLLSFTFGQDFTGHEITGFDVMRISPRLRSGYQQWKKKDYLSSSSLPTLRNSLARDSELRGGLATTST